MKIEQKKALFLFKMLNQQKYFENYFFFFNFIMTYEWAVCAYIRVASKCKLDFVFSHFLLSN